MKVIMNPPYNRSLHLKILSHIISLYPEATVANLSPIRWLQDPLAEYKKNSDWKKFEDVRKHIKSIEAVDSMFVKECFDAYFTSNIGIYHIDKNIHNVCLNKNSIVEKVEAKILSGELDSLYQHIEYKKNDGWRVRVSELRPCPVGRPKTQVLVKNMMFETTHNVLSWVYKDGYTKDGVYWTKNNLNGGHGLKEFAENEVLPMSIPFASMKEAVNFENSTKTNFHRYLIMTIKTDQHFPFKWVPYLGDYTHPWTDEMLYKYFDLTEDEINEIEETIK